jgi:DNA-binding response OmpR family regulator
MSESQESDVFVADDEAKLRELVAFHLETAGHDVTIFPDGQACWQRLQEADQLPGVILTDVMMPHMDGFQLVQRVRDDGNLSEIPIVILTGRGTESDVVRGLEIGANDYLTKPFRSQELIAHIERYL